ncbi:MAG: PEP-CTERM sorting domain-containing protein [Phycisphaerales bacterium]|nr:PEP-CTERM sorting domain-containing protein [Phycisphaerales bacterium]
MRVLVSTLVLAIATTASASLMDDFESYGTTGDMQAAWGAAGLGSLDTVVGNPGQSMFHPGGTQNTRLLDTPLTEAAGQPIVWEFDLFEQFPLGNKRITATLDKVAFGWLELGLYNNLVEPVGGGTVDGYGMRILGHGGEQWVSFPNDPVSRTGWHHFKATITADNILFEVWLTEGMNPGGGTSPAEYSSYTSTAHDGTGLTWDEVKIGGPSNLSSANGGAHFDNMSVTQIPEPATIALLLIGGAATMRRRR